MKQPGTGPGFWQPHFSVQRWSDQMGGCVS